MHASRVISIINFLACAGVIALHCHCGGSRAEKLVKACCGWAVPWFFFSSGLLFVQSAFRHSPAKLLRRKVVSVLIPYVIWTFAGFMVAYLLGQVDEFQALKVFGVSVTHPIGNPPLWFMRTLIALIPVALCIHVAAAKVAERIGYPWMYELSFAVIYAALWTTFHGKVFPFISTSMFFIGCLLSRVLFGKSMTSLISSFIPNRELFAKAEKHIFSMSAFVYFWHNIFLNVVHHYWKQPLIRLSGGGYVVLWLLAVVVCFFASFMLRCHAPLLYRALSGARK